MPESLPDSPTAAVDLLGAGRAALLRHDWQTAFERLSEADRRSALPADDLEALAVAAFFTARADVQIEMMERAFQAHLTEGANERAAYVALEVAREYFYAGRPSIASGWVGRAERLLTSTSESPAHGLLALVRSQMALNAGDLDVALSLAEQATAIGERASDADLRAHALANLGELKIVTGTALDGLVLLEEASVSAVNGELSLYCAGITCCRMIAACRELGDYGRASEWIEQAERYCQRQDVSGFPGVCRIHRAEINAVRGAWEQAEDELERATEELRPYNAVPPIADGLYAIGEIRRLRGDYAAAEAALREADARGRTTQPARALIRLAKGDSAGALVQIDRALADETWDLSPGRALLLGAQVEIALAAGEVGRARKAAEELGEIVAPYPTPALDAGRGVALGRVLLAEGDAQGAARELRRAIRGWRDVGAPYEVARARALLAGALRDLDDEEDADLELQVALDTFQRLGAAPDAGAAALALRAASERRGERTKVHRTFMFTDVESSTQLAERLGDVAWAQRLRWHDETLRSLIANAGGETVNSTGDGFFAAFHDAGPALASAIAIQRALRADRQPDADAVIRVRIGLHTAEANRAGADYTGLGVHVAARVCALARGGEILATADVLAEAAPAGIIDEREVSVRGISAPVRVAVIDST